MALHQIKQLQSKPLREIATRLFLQQVPVTAFGKVWSKCTNNWIYFDTCLDIESLKTEYELGDTFEVHENLDPKSGTERGIIDTHTGEAIMGKIE